MHPMKVTSRALLMTRNILAAITFALLLACGGVGPDGLAFTVGSISVGKGQSQIVSVTIYSKVDGEASVAFRASRLPSGVTATFDPVTVLPHANTTKLTINASASAVPGTYTADITATESTGARTTSMVKITVTQPTAGSFTVSVSPILILDFVAGVSQTVEYTVRPVGSFAGTVNLALSTESNDFLPGGLYPPSVDLSTGVKTGQFSIVLEPNGEVETEDVVLTGTSGTTTQTAEVRCGQVGG